MKNSTENKIKGSFHEATGPGRLVDMPMTIVSGVNALDKATRKPFFTNATLARKKRQSAMEVNARCGPSAGQNL
jgi:hypothetical protein